MLEETGCAGIAIGRGALLDPWIFRRLQLSTAGDETPWVPTPEEQLRFLARHFALMV